MGRKLLSLVLAIAGVLLVYGGAGAAVTAQPGAPTVYAMLLAMAAFGVGCLFVAYGIYKTRRWAFTLCLLLGVSVAGFAIAVSELPGEGFLWPTFAIMTIIGLLGALCSRKRSG